VRWRDHREEQRRSTQIQNSFDCHHSFHRAVGVSIPLLGRRISTLRLEHIGSSCSSLGFVILHVEGFFLLGKKGHRFRFKKKKKNLKKWHFSNSVSQNDVVLGFSSIFTNVEELNYK
jgi:hypothetical protein